MKCPFFRLLLSLLAITFFISCSDDSTSPEKEDNNNNEFSEDMYQSDKRKKTSDAITYELKDNVSLMSEIQKNSLIAIKDGSLLIFKSDVINHPMPKVGDIFVCMEASDILPQGFQGRIKKIEKSSDGSVYVYTEPTQINEIFSNLEISTQLNVDDYNLLDSLGNSLECEEVYINTDSIEWDSDSTDTNNAPFNNKTTRAFTHEIKAKVFKINLGNAIHAVGNSTTHIDTAVSGTLTLGGNITIDYDPFKEYFYLGNEMYAELNADLTLEEQIGVDYEETKRFLGTIPIANISGFPIFTINLNIYGYFTERGGIKLSCELVSCRFSNKSYLKHEKGKFSFDSKAGGTKKDDIFKNKPNGEYFADFGVGVRCVVGLNAFQCPVVNHEDLYFDIWAGLKGNVPAELDMVKKAQADLVVEGGLYASFGTDNPLGFYAKMENEFTRTLKLNSFYFCPIFDNWMHTGSESINVSCSLSRSMLFPVKTGFILKDVNNNVIQEYEFDDFYWLQSLSHRFVQHTFTNLKKNTIYRVYPFVRYLDLWRRTYVSDDYYEFSDTKSDHNTGFQYCPDNNHPHAIDLGLPSGIKWACCNVGASSPEGYGGYYAWGEVKEKETYTWANYQYSNSTIDCFNQYGSDIAGTAYDVAHVRMGGSWRMPSKSQQDELRANCTITWIQQNDVSGILATGKNGNSIFFPAAGYRHASDLYEAGSGYVWSSTLSALGAYFLTFSTLGSGSCGWASFLDNGHGLSVRAVCP